MAKLNVKAPCGAVPLWDWLLLGFKKLQNVNFLEIWPRISRNLDVMKSFL